MKHDTPPHLSWRSARAQAIEDINRRHIEANPPRVLHYRPSPVSDLCRVGMHGACDGLSGPNLCWCECRHPEPVPRKVSLHKLPRYREVQL